MQKKVQEQNNFRFRIYTWKDNLATRTVGMVVWILTPAPPFSLTLGFQAHKSQWGKIKQGT